ncbi:hypothetical protein DICVIV_12948 [Dictyocaulus viviparus]|uniref:Protein quiver n=1 Tax=Dictyocaulus viviparus TaxID=29172 RepID=A0A0D8XBP7_DICVI|nr:hypothetical protein DICVIV_12948 [Dictyocaulus viviparus]
MLLFMLLLPITSSRMCYQCASELALINWSRYGLPHQRGDSMMADDTCLDDAHLQGHLACNAPCMTINITAIGGKHDGRVIASMFFGIVRDCQTYFRSPKLLPEGTTSMCRHSVRETKRSQRVNVTFCYCQKNLCNGDYSLTNLRRAAERIHPSTNSAFLINRNFLTCLAIITICYA